MSIILLSMDFLSKSFRFAVYKKRYQLYASDRALCKKMCGGYTELKDLTSD